VIHAGSKPGFATTAIFRNKENHAENNYGEDNGTGVEDIIEYRIDFACDCGAAGRHKY